MKINEQNYVDEAEKVIKRLINLKDKKGRTVPLVTTSKIRNLLAMTSDIYNEVMNQNGDKLDESICERIEYLRVRFIYESGREDSVKRLVEYAEIIELLKEIGNSKKNYILFNHYIESLVAFHKYYGGKEN
jgi:CRISPR-associated protein Csm2